MIENQGKQKKRGQRGKAHYCQAFALYSTGDGGGPVEQEDVEVQDAAAQRVTAHLSFVLRVLQRPGLE